MSAAVRNLGVIFDCHMSMNNNITKICQTANFYLRKVSLLKRYLTQNSRHTLIQSLVVSRIDYASALLAGVPDAQFRRLQRVLNHAARIITSSSSRDHIMPILSRLHWLPVKQRVIFKIVCFVYKALHEVAPLYLSQLLDPYRLSRALRSMDDTTLLSVPCTRSTTMGDRAFSRRVA